MEKFKIGDKVKIVGNHSDPHYFEIGEIVTIKGYNSIGDRYHCTNQSKDWHVNIDCVAKVEDTITQELKVGDWVPKEDFVLYNSYEPEDSSEWKVGDQLQLIRVHDRCIGFDDCTIDKIYTCYFDSDGDPYIIDDVGDSLSINISERKCFRKIINNQKQQSYVKDNSNTSNSIELPSSSPTISARQTARGGIVSSSDLEVWI